MNTAVLCLVLAAVVSTFAAKAKYTTRFDNVNLEEILNNERLFNSYYNCLMDEGPCTPDGKVLKESLPDALKNDCALCSEKQKEGSDRVLKFLYEVKPDHFSALEKKYDEDGIYKKKYLAKKKQQRAHQRK